MRHYLLLLFISVCTVCYGKFRIPERHPGTVTGTEFITETINMNPADREQRILEEALKGNVPDFMRTPAIIRSVQKDAEEIEHMVEIRVLPDFFAVGTDEDFIRMPMIPATAQMIANRYNANLPTRKISDLIHSAAGIKMEPMPMTPDETMITVPVFTAHNSMIEAGRKIYSLPLHTLIAGHKKDIVITNRMYSEPGRLFIYGWHYPGGKAIQPLSAAHHDGYADYSHGARLIDREVRIDGIVFDIREVLNHPVLYKLLSDEDGPMQQTGYPVE